MNAPEYKVGDKVTIRSKYHINCESSDYACSFTEGMRATFGGNLCTIDSIYLVDKVDAFGNHKKAYTLKEDPEKLLYTAYMFEESGTPQAFIDKLVKEELEKPFNGMLKDIPEKVVEEMLREQYRQTGNIDKSVFEVDIKANSFNKGFDWGLSLKGFPFWDSIISRRMYGLLYEDTDRKITKDETLDSQSQKLNINIILLNTPKSKNKFNLIKNIYEKN